MHRQARGNEGAGKKKAHQVASPFFCADRWLSVPLRALRGHLLLFALAFWSGIGLLARALFPRLLIGRRRIAGADRGLLLLLTPGDLNALRLRQRGFGNADRENAVFELRLDLILVHALRKSEC